MPSLPNVVDARAGFRVERDELIAGRHVEHARSAAAVGPAMRARVPTAAAAAAAALALADCAVASRASRRSAASSATAALACASRHEDTAVYHQRRDLQVALTARAERVGPAAPGHFEVVEILSIDLIERRVPGAGPDPHRRCATAVCRAGLTCTGAGVHAAPRRPEQDDGHGECKSASRAHGSNSKVRYQMLNDLAKYIAPRRRTRPTLFGRVASQRDSVISWRRACVRVWLWAALAGIKPAIPATPSDYRALPKAIIPAALLRAARRLAAPPRESTGRLTDEAWTTVPPLRLATSPRSIP